MRSASDVRFCRVFNRLLAAFAVCRTAADLAANLTAGEIRRVHVRVGQTVGHGF